jgi:hypothetical protein
VGIYRNGQLVEAIAPTRMTLFRLNRGVTLMMAMMPLAVFGLICCLRAYLRFVIRQGRT